MGCGSTGTATAGSDYTAASGALSFAPGELTKTVTVNVTGDASPFTLAAAAQRAGGVRPPAGSTISQTLTIRRTGGPDLSASAGARNLGHKS
ncbi:MAG: hypothetical protein H0W82_07120 [Actinobacteria bacterium]|nr:hypothetical protein [Actinomycetota bacterium]